jgi:acetyl esterase/lipase
LSRLALVLLAACNGAMESYFAEDVVHQIDDVVYVDGSTDPRQRLDLVIPRDVDHFPVVVFIHGGFWIHQDKDYFQPYVGLYHNVGIALGRHGIGSAIIDYRLVPEVTFEEQLDDVAASITWVHDHIADHGGDPDSIIVAGHSAGGHITALLAFDDSRLATRGVDLTSIKGYAPLSPIVDLAQMAASSTDNAQIADEVFGGALVEYSPVTYFHAAVAPVFLALGSNDLDFLLEQVPAAATALAGLGAPVTFETIPGKSHDDMVVDFDTGNDLVTPLLVPFIETATQ